MRSEFIRRAIYKQRAQIDFQERKIDIFAQFNLERARRPIHFVIIAKECKAFRIRNLECFVTCLSKDNLIHKNSYKRAHYFYHKSRKSAVSSQKFIFRAQFSNLTVCECYINATIKASKQFSFNLRISVAFSVHNNLNFSSHIKEICGKVNQKTSALSRLLGYINGKKAKLLLNTVVRSNFQYCPLIGLFCSKAADILINRTTKRKMRIIYNNDSEEALDALLQRDGTLTSHKKNLQKLMVEIYRTINHLNPPYMWDIFTNKLVEYDLRTKILCKLPPAKSQRFCTNSLKFKGSLLWNSLSDEIKTARSLVIFKQKSNPGMAPTARATSAETKYLYIYFILPLRFFPCKLSMLVLISLHNYSSLHQP